MLTRRSRNAVAILAHLLLPEETGMEELIELAQLAGKGAQAEAMLRQKLGSKRKYNHIRRLILQRATEEERRIADFAISFAGGDLSVLCAIAARHAS